MWFHAGIHVINWEMAGGPVELAFATCDSLCVREELPTLPRWIQLDLGGVAVIAPKNQLNQSKEWHEEGGLCASTCSPKMFDNILSDRFLQAVRTAVSDSLPRVFTCAPSTGIRTSGKPCTLWGSIGSDATI